MMIGNDTTIDEKQMTSWLNRSPTISKWDCSRVKLALDAKLSDEAVNLSEKLGVHMQ